MDQVHMRPIKNNVKQQNRMRYNKKEYFGPSAVAIHTEQKKSTKTYLQKQLSV